MTNLYEINDLVNFLDKHRITAEQFIYCLLLYYDKRYSKIPGTNNISRPLSQLYKYHNNIKNFTKEDLETLVEKGFIVQTGNKIVPDMLEITDKFEKEYLGDNLKFIDVWETYPAWVENFTHPSKGNISLKTTSDYTGTMNLYNKFVKTQKVHERVIEAIEWGKTTKCINMSLERFVNSKAWEAIWEMQKDSQTNDQFEML